jgi:hypothetical protein
VRREGEGKEEGEGEALEEKGEEWGGGGRAPSAWWSFGRGASRAGEKGSKVTAEPRLKGPLPPSPFPCISWPEPSSLPLPSRLNP